MYPEAQGESEATRLDSLVLRMQELSAELDVLRNELAIEKGRWEGQAAIDHAQIEGRELSDLQEFVESPSEATETDSFVSRRHALRAAGLVAVGAVAGGVASIATAGPAAAASGTFDGSPAVTIDTTGMGIQSTSSGTTTQGILSTANGTNMTAIQGVAQGTGGWGVNGVGAAVGVFGWASAASGTGVAAFSDQGAAIQSNSNSGDALVAESASGYGIHAMSSGTDKAAIWAVGGGSAKGLSASSGTTAVQAVSSQVAVHAFVGSGGTAVLAEGGSVALSVAGETSIRFHGTYDPTSDTVPHNLADLVVDTTGTMWFNVAAGSPGSWIQIAGPSAAGAFHPVTPGRAYDSRVASFSPNGPLGSGLNRTISLANSYDVNGTIATANFVPSGSTAVFANVTVVDTVGSGYLAVNPGGTTAVSASTINWTASGQTLANGVTLKLNNSRQITVVNGSGGSTHFIIDVLGYYR
jgi:hypothetical protein